MSSSSTDSYPPKSSFEDFSSALRCLGMIEGGSASPSQHLLVLAQGMENGECTRDGVENALVSFVAQKNRGSFGHYLHAVEDEVLLLLENGLISEQCGRDLVLPLIETGDISLARLEQAVRRSFRI